MKMYTLEFFSKQIEEHDFISIISHLAQQHTETVTDLEKASKFLHSLTGNLDNFLTILDNLNHGFITLENYRIHVWDKFMFKIMLLVSLKYKKSIFIECEISFLQSVVEEILETIKPIEIQSIHLLKLLEMILKKRPDVLTPSLSFFVLKTMNKVSYSPLTGFKSSAHDVSRLVLTSLSPEIREKLCDLSNYPVKGADLSDILKLSDIQCFDLANRIVLKLFKNNTDSRDAGFYYEAVLKNLSFDDFIENVWPHYRAHFAHFDDGEFYQSFLKYWIPITVKTYNDFYTFIQSEHTDYYLKACTLLETRKKGFYSAKFNSDALTFVKYSKTSKIGLKIVSLFLKKYTVPSCFEMQCVEMFLNCHSQFEFSEDVLKSLKKFLSQIFLSCHLNKNSCFKAQQSFLNFIYNFCLLRLSDDNEIAAQVLKIVFDVATGSSADLLTSYKINQENFYPTGGNSFYQKLQKSGFWSNTFLSTELGQKISSFVEGLKHCPKLISIVKSHYQIDFNFTSASLLQMSVCAQSSEKVRAYAELWDQINIEEFNQLFNEKLQSDLFICVLILDIFVVALKHNINIVPVLEKSLTRIDDILDQSLVELNPRQAKVTEAFINNVIECLGASRPHWNSLDSSRLLKTFYKIIQLSNMKRPVTLAAKFLVNFSIDYSTKITLLDSTLALIYADKSSGKIRRNPETRLVIHALCLSDKNPRKPLLHSAVKFMFEVLENPSSTDSNLSATLHSLEVLFSDNSLYQHTLSYIPHIIQHCVKIFDRNSWVVRNADLQLLKALIERLLGVSLHDNIRPKTIEDVFVLFPSLSPIFHEELAKPNRALLLILFFSESYIKCDFLLEQDFDMFRALFSRIILEKNSNDVTQLAIKAFSALCPVNQIGRIFAEVGCYIECNFAQMDKNIFARLMTLVQELAHKYKLSLIQNESFTALNNIVRFLRQFDCTYFSILSLKLSTVEEVISKIRVGDYKSRIFCNNYIPFVIQEADLCELDSILNTLLSHDLPSYLHVKILSALVDRSSEENFPKSLVRTLVLKVPTLNDHFVTTVYAKTILSLCVDLNLSDVLPKIRKDFHTENIYKIFVYIFALAHCPTRSQQDDIFISRCVQKYIKALNNDEILPDLSATMAYLHQVAVNDRYNTIKLVFYLLLNETTSFEMCLLVSNLTKSHCSSVLISLMCLLNNLDKYVDEPERLLKDFFAFLEEPEEESHTFYLIESDWSLSKDYVKLALTQAMDKFHAF